MKYLFLYIFILLTQIVYGQKTVRLSFNSFYDADPNINGKIIAWSGGMYGEPKEIYIIKNGYTQRLTYDDYNDYEPLVGNNYIIWRRTKNQCYCDYNNSLMVYDGQKIWAIDHGNISNYSTYNNKIFWINRVVTKFYPDTLHFYLFDGNKIIRDFAPPHAINDGVQRAMMGENFFAVVKKENDSTYTLYKNNVNDSEKVQTIINDKFSGIKIIENALFYSIISSSDFSRKDFLYFDKKTIPLKFPDSLHAALPQQFLDHETYVLTSNNYSPDKGPQLFVWHKGQIYFLGYYPYTTINQYTELKNINYFFTVSKFISNIVVREIYVLTENKVYNLSVPNLTNESFSVTGKNAVWYAYTSNWPEHDKYYNEAEIYTACLDSICNEPWAVKKINIDVFFSDRSKNITIKILDIEKNNYLYSIYDVNGKLIVRNSFSTLYGENKIDYNTYNLAAGIYLIDIHSAVDFSVRKIKKLFITN